MDEMVARAKEMKAGETLPFLKMTVSEKGVNVAEMPQNANKDFEAGFYNIDVIRSVTEHFSILPETSCRNVARYTSISR